MSSEAAEPIAASIRTQFTLFENETIYAPRIHVSGRFVGIDNSQQRQYNLVEIRGKLPHLPLVQVVGDSGSAFDANKIPLLQTMLSEHAADCLVEYGFSSMRHDTNWLVGEHLRSHPTAVGIANIVQQSVDALEAEFEGCRDVAFSLLLFNRLSSTRFGDDTWLSDGIMFKDLGDKMLCFEGGPQALYQCASALTRGIKVLAVTNLRSRRFSASRILIDFAHDPKCTLDSSNLTARQLKVARWCLAALRNSDQDITSLIVPVELE